MGKFLSYDGVDKNGIRAEVMVQTGTGKIKEIVPRGKAGKDGTYRNVEVVFTPDNPKLIRKVYALLDTTSKELWDYVQEVQASEKDISYRIESQRKRTIDRVIKFDDLTHSEEVVRVLAGIDDKFSHEAKTNPVEDPTNDAPSALTQEVVKPASTSVSILATEVSSDPKHLLKSLGEARALNLSQTTIDTLVALAVGAGATIDEALSVGIGNESVTVISDKPIVGRSYAVEEKPWTAYNSDGRVNAGSYMVAHAASTERFALDHLIGIYSEGKKTQVDVTDEMISQAASLALVLLEMSDEVQRRVTGRIDRQKNSYNRAMALVLDAVDKRYLAPVGGNAEAQETWKTSAVHESIERLRGVLAIAEGKIPLAENVDANLAVPEAEEPKAKQNGVAALKATLGAVEKVLPKTSFKSEENNLLPGQEGFVDPSQLVIEKLKGLCVDAGVSSETTAISNWLEASVGSRMSRRVNEPVLLKLIGHYAAMDIQEVKTEILSHK